MITIGAVSRQTGIPAATLRKWEERYGFPVPLRTQGGQRVFSAQDLGALVEVSRRIAAGQRAGTAIRAARAPLEPHGAGQTADLPTAPDVAKALDLLQHNELGQLERLIAGQLAGVDVWQFSRDFAIPLMEAVGCLWQQGSLAVYQEHLFTSTFQGVLSRALPGLTRAPSGGLRVLLASPAGEMHTLALVLINALLCEAGIATTFLQGSLPAAEIASAVRSLGVHVVALSASVACPPKLLKLELESLRARIDPGVRVWVGGAGTRRISSCMAGIEVVPSIADALQQLKTMDNHVLTIVGTQKEKRI
ncbi:MAG: cobalamin B12-binding domain-containing protein [Rhodoferax sp.]